ncbi:type II toxin-antitoxin system CcdA family antitoxin [Ewingella sp. S1.OA.A_B6]
MTKAQNRKFNELPAAQLQGTPAEKWQRENQKGIEAIKKYAEENGSFSDYQRAF